MSRGTQDADICPDWSTENLGRLAAALTELQARLKIGERSVDTLAVELDARTIHSLEIGAWRTPPATSMWRERGRAEDRPDPCPGGLAGGHHPIKGGHR